jgi:hypothetical protein
MKIDNLNRKEASKQLSLMIASGLTTMLEALDYDHPVSGEPSLDEGLLFAYIRKKEDGTYYVRAGIDADTHFSPRLEGSKELAVHMEGVIRWWEKANE